MKKILLILALACLLSGHAYADVFVPDCDTVLEFQQIPVGTNAWLQGVFDCRMTPPQKVPGSLVDVYQDKPQASAGFVGTISGNEQWIRIGLQNGEFGTYTGLRMFLANDNQSTWEVRLFANTCEPEEWVRLGAPGNSFGYATAKEFELSFDEADLTAFGFDVRLNTEWCGAPSITDTFHVSAVPVPIPAAALLGMLGLATAGTKLRKFV